MFLLWIFLFSCAAGVSQRSKGTDPQTPPVQEDLSAFRPKYNPDSSVKEKVKPVSNEPFKPTLDVTALLNKKLNEISVSQPNVAKGFRVMLFSGSNKEEATIIREKVAMLVNDKVYMDYKAPNFRVKVGDAINRLEANYLLGKLKNDFPGAFIVPDEININY